MVIFMSKYVPCMLTMMSPLRMLLRIDMTRIWDTPQQSAFDNVKQAIASSGVLAFYDPQCPTTVSTNTSRLGLVVPNYRNMMECTRLLRTSQEP